MAALVLFTRIVLIGEIWLEARKDLEDFRSLKQFIFPGARILATSVLRFEDRASYFRDQPRSRQLRGITDTYSHFVGFWVIDRGVFWPLLFSNPSQQPIRAIPPYDQLAVPVVRPPPDYRLLAHTPLPADALYVAPYLSDWVANFDFVVVLSSGRAKHLDELDDLPLTLIKKTDIATLYSIRKPASN
jgi:hypothetical protein